MTQLLFLLIVLACPLSMMFMMRGMHGGRRHAERGAHRRAGARGRAPARRCPGTPRRPTADPALTVVEMSATHRQHVAPTVTSAAAAPAGTGRADPSWLRALWNSVVGGIAAVVGLAPHVLHHVGLLAGTALVAGAGGTLLFGAVGLAASVPFLLRLRRRFGTWRAPAIALSVFAAMFSLSAFVIGPAISGSDSPGGGPAQQQIDHSAHHGGQP